MRFLKAITERWLARPDLLFLFFAVPFGLVFALFTPPLGSGDEGAHFQRVASIAYGHLLDEKVMVPSGIYTFLKTSAAVFLHNLTPPNSYSLEHYRQLASIPLYGAGEETLSPNFFTIHHPFGYIPQILVFRLGVCFALPPLALLLLMRLGGMVAGIWLTVAAIRRMPSHAYIMCALALLPTALFYRSCLNADSVTTGLAFLLIACTLQEVAGQGHMQTKNILRLAIIAFVLAQCKSAYLLLPLLTLAIPKERFSSLSNRIATLGIITVPGIVLSIAWMMAMKQSYFTGAHYHTWGGDVAPDAQMAFILHYPLLFMKILFDTVFSMSFFIHSIVGILGELGWGHIVFPLAAYMVFTCVFAVIIIYDVAANTTSYNKCLRLLAATIFAGVLTLTLTILYTQWTGLEAPLIQGFQGRYFIPILPLLPLLLPRLVRPWPPSLKAGLWTAAFASASLLLSTYEVWFTYFGRS